MNPCSADFAFQVPVVFDHFSLPVMFEYAGISLAANVALFCSAAYEGQYRVALGIGFKSHILSVVLHIYQGGRGVFLSQLRL